MTTTCPTADALVAFGEGTLTVMRRQQVADHIDRCPACAGMVGEVAQLVDQDDAWATRFTTTACGLHARQGWMRHDRPLPLGSVIGRYLSISRIGAGGLGDVYLGYDPELDRRVALKILRTAASDSHRRTFKARLIHEARALARVSHPNVVHVYEVGEFGDHLYIAMELVVGVTLRQWLSERSRSWQEVRDVFVAAGKGLAAAHEVGLVHRDFKPDNVLIGRDGRVRVLDFGLARALEISGGAEHVHGAGSISGVPMLAGRSVTAPLTLGAAVGTPAYMAPEQYRRDEIDVRVDQFAFCVSLFEALHGVRPFRGENFAQLAAAITQGRVRRPEMAGRIPAWLDRTIARGLSVRPEERFASMRALLSALDQDTRKRRYKWRLLFGVVMASVALTWAVVWFVRPPADFRQDVQRLAAQAEVAARDGYYVYPPRDAPQKPTVYRTIVELEALADQGSELAAERASALRATSAASLLELGDQYWDQPGAAPFAADYYAAVLLFDPEQARARERAPSTHGELGGLRRQAEGQTFSAAELAAGESLAALAQPNVAERRNRVERLFASNTLPLSTEARLEQVLGVTERRSQPQKTGVSVQQPSPVADTERTEPEAPEEAAAPDPPDPLPDLRPSPAAARVELTRAQTALRRGAVDTAEQHFHRALRFDHRSLAALIGLAEVGFQRGAHDSAVRYAEKATRLHPTDPRGYMIAGNAYLRMLRYQAALAAYRRAGALGHRPAGRRIAKLEHLLGIEASDRKGTP